MPDRRELVVVGAHLPSPPYPADTRTHGWHFQVDLARVRQSDTWTLCSGEFRPWLLWLWIRSWDEIPTGSYPNDDAIIAAKIGMTAELFDGHRAMLMRGWYRASDNRLYHPYIAELVRDRIAWKEAERARKAAWRASLVVPRDIHGLTRDGDDTGVGVGVGVGVDSSSTPLVLAADGTKTPKVKTVGTRLLEDWRIPEDWIAIGLAVHPDWSRAGVIRESLTFRDYWHAKSGKDATKVSWIATWRNWIRRAEKEPTR